MMVTNKPLPVAKRLGSAPNKSRGITSQIVVDKHIKAYLRYLPDGYHVPVGGIFNVRVCFFVYRFYIELNKSKKNKSSYKGQKKNSALIFQEGLRGRQSYQREYTATH